jgi:thioredoxin
MGTIQHLTGDTFADAVAGPRLTVIDFWASWCGPCRAMAPQFEHAATLRPQYQFAKVDVDTEPELAARFQIQSIPTLMVLLDAEPVAAHAGVIPADALVKALDRIASADRTDERKAA